MLDPAATDAAEMAPSKKKRSPRKKFEIPDGWIARGFVFEVAWHGDLELAGRVRSQFGARGGNVRPLQSQKAAPGEARTEPGNRRGTPRRGAA